MKKLLVTATGSLLAAMMMLAATSCGAVREKAPTPPAGPNNLTVQIDDADAARAEIQVALPGTRDTVRYEIRANQGALTGGIFVPPGAGRRVAITVFDPHGSVQSHGSTLVDINENVNPSVVVPLRRRRSDEVAQAVLGTFRVQLDSTFTEAGAVRVRVTVFDAEGKSPALSAEDIRWNLPDGPPIQPNNCFNSSLCVELPFEAARFSDRFACYRDLTCWGKKPADTNGPWRAVAVGLNHTCALTVSNTLFCWGENTAGQLGAPTPSSCPGLFISCSPTPVAVVCQAGAACKFNSVAAGGDHTCAVDTAGKVWCWGDFRSPATGPQPGGGVLGSPDHREIAANTNTGQPVQFAQVDTNRSHSCAVSTSGAVFCWGDNGIGQLGSQAGAGSDRATLVPNGNLYKMVAVGSRHTCAVQRTGGSMECWGDNFDLQLSTGTPTLPSTGQFFSITVNSKHPLLNGKGVSLAAAGDTNTCAQNSDDDTICWGSSTHFNPTGSAGFIALHSSFATSLATDSDTCLLAGTTLVPCTRTCLTGLGGDLHCGQWSTLNNPPPLAKVPAPAGLPYASYAQVDVGPNHVCALTSKRDIFCFGLNTSGQFGTGAVSNTRTDVPVAAARRM